MYFKGVVRQELETIIDKCAAEFKTELNEDTQMDFYIKAKSFFRTYAFLSKLLSFNNAYWERLYWFLKFLIPKVKPEEMEDLAKGILEAIDLDSYRLTRTIYEDIKLKGKEALDPAPPVMKGKKGEPLFNELDSIINDFNARFGINNWTDDDKVKNFLFVQLSADFARDEAAVNAVKNSDKQNAKITSDKKVEDLMQDVIYQYTDLYKKFTGDPDFKRQYLDFVFDKIWNQQNSDEKSL